MCEVCSICLDEINGESNKLVTECNHTFHTNCYLSYSRNWYSKSDSVIKCPNCRNTNVENVSTKITNKISLYDHNFKVGDLVLYYTLTCSFNEKQYRLFTVTSINEKSITICMNSTTVTTIDGSHNIYKYILDKYNKKKKIYVNNPTKLYKFVEFREYREGGNVYSVDDGYISETFTLFDIDNFVST